LCKKYKIKIKTTRKGTKKCEIYTKKALRIKVKLQKCLNVGKIQKIYLNNVHKNGRMLIDGRNE
jgi:hypothetical protein